MLRHRQTHFLVLEGLDGAGTTTQARALCDALEGPDLRVLCTAEPSEGPIGRLLRTYVRGEIDLDPVAATLMFTADRADHLARVVRPALAEGRTVVSDRYLLSTLAYQGAAGVDRAWIMDISRGFDVPDVTVFCDLPEDERLSRVEARGSQERFDDPALGESLRESYLVSIELLRASGQRIEVVDGSGPPDQVTDRVLAALGYGQRSEG